MNIIWRNIVFLSKSNDRASLVNKQKQFQIKKISWSFEQFATFWTTKPKTNWRHIFEAAASAFGGKITVGQADKKQTNLLHNTLEFNNKARPKAKADKKKKW